jgi:nitrogen fixation NifU-like protein
MTDDLYRHILLEHWKNPKNSGTLKNKSARSFALNPSCGDKIAMDVLIEKGKIRDVKFTGEGCVLSQASASMLTEYAKGRSVKELQTLDVAFMQHLLEIPLTPVRLKCVLLSLEVLQKAIKRKKNA